MALIKEGSEIQLECDLSGCKSITETYSNSEFGDMLSDAKADNWLIYKDEESGKFLHFCTWSHGGKGPVDFKEYDEADLL